MLQMINNKNFKITILTISLLLLTACGKEKSVEDLKDIDNKLVSDEKVGYSDVAKNASTEEAKKAPSNAKEIKWEELVPADYDPNAVVSKYLDEINSLDDSDQEAMVLYGKIQAELDNAPVNEAMDGKTIKMPGFIAPLENENGLIGEFLLVPYFGACIHSPPPPVNQTVLIKSGKGQEVKSEDANYPVWITGKITVAKDRTQIGTSGYRIENAVVEPYEDDIPNN